MRLPDELLRRLERDGWSVTRQHDGLEWWAHEIWTLESRWSPHGVILFLTFLTDPQPGNPNPFWLIGTCSRFPQDRHEAGGDPCLKMTPRWEDDVPDFVARLDALRRGGLVG